MHIKVKFESRILEAMKQYISSLNKELRNDKISKHFKNRAFKIL